MDDVKVFFQKLIDDGSVKATISGPKNNVLVCATTSDWCIASGELVHAGYEVDSPGSFGGSHPTSRQNTHNKIWKSGTVCASVVEKKVLVFSLPQTINDHCDVIHKKN